MFRPHLTLDNLVRKCRPTLSPLTSYKFRLFSSTSSLPPILLTPGHHASARQWLNTFKESGVEGIPKEGYEITMSRSSGPGGQNVNKVSTKATLKMILSNQQSWLPDFVKTSLASSTHYLPSPPTLLLSSSLTRTASQNRLDVIFKLHRTLVSHAEDSIINPTSDEQVKKVEMLKRKMEIARKREKMKGKDKKMSRGKGSGGGWD